MADDDDDFDTSRKAWRLRQAFFMAVARKPARWNVAEMAPADFLHSAPGLHPLLMQVLHARNLRTTHEALRFIEGETVEHTVALADVDKAVQRILTAIKDQEKIAVYGDYDCDGVTSCALVWLALRALGAQVQVYIPDRFDEGYGLNTGALTKLKTEHVALVISVDCGGRAIAEAEHARKIGLDLIITDHHDLDQHGLPDALAVINPKRLDCPYPFKQLAGVGVAYRLVQELWRHMAGETPALQGKPEDFLDLVAIGTVADVMPLTGENRQLVKIGLERINANPRLGVRELMRASKIKPGGCTARDLGFALGPRLNAAGRMESALSAYEVLTTDNPSWALELADLLNDRNNERQAVTNQMVAAADAMIAVHETLPAVLMAGSTEFNAGVIGLAAARLAERHTRPAIVMTIDGSEARGSCRSVPGFHITRALDKCTALLKRHGGHAAAAGFTADVSQLGLLETQLNADALEQMPADGWERVIEADAAIQLHKLSRATFDALQLLEPHGQANPRPILACIGATLGRAQRMGRAESGGMAPHLKLILKDQRGGQWEAVGWRMGERMGEAAIGSKVDVVFQLDLNEWNGETKLQLILLDWRPS